MGLTILNYPKLSALQRRSSSEHALFGKIMFGARQGIDMIAIREHERKGMFPNAYSVCIPGQKSGELF